eukprot:TRINITY_DN794_c0_g3_i1.p1 TRINITY_DN794_c0_g3~~TRINITY_DN794_c0_g3_i1.p1  ORF type:complete len:1764 (-),score=549.87 TRINITY_DN794_c0_g3_i1:299-5590(-)
MKKSTKSRGINHVSSSESKNSKVAQGNKSVSQSQKTLTLAKEKLAELESKIQKRKNLNASFIPLISSMLDRLTNVPNKKSPFKEQKKHSEERKLQINACLQNDLHDNISKDKDALLREKINNLKRDLAKSMKKKKRIKQNESVAAKDISVRELVAKTSASSPKQVVNQIIAKPDSSKVSITTNNRKELRADPIEHGVNDDKNELIVVQPSTNSRLNQLSSRLKAIAMSDISLNNNTKKKNDLIMTSSDDDDDDDEDDFSSEEESDYSLSSSENEFGKPPKTSGTSKKQHDLFLQNGNNATNNLLASIDEEFDEEQIQKNNLISTAPAFTFEKLFGDSDPHSVFKPNTTTSDFPKTTGSQVPPMMMQSSPLPKTSSIRSGGQRRQIISSTTSELLKKARAVPDTPSLISNWHSNLTKKNLEQYTKLKTVFDPDTYPDSSSATDCTDSDEDSIDVQSFMIPLSFPEEKPIESPIRPKTIPRTSSFAFASRISQVLSPPRADYSPPRTPPPPSSSDIPVTTTTHTYTHDYKSRRSSMPSNISSYGTTASNNLIHNASLRASLRLSAAPNFSNLSDYESEDLQSERSSNQGKKKHRPAGDSDEDLSTIVRGLLEQCDTEELNSVDRHIDSSIPSRPVSNRSSVRSDVSKQQISPPSPCTSTAPRTPQSRRPSQMSFRSLSQRESSTQDVLDGAHDELSNWDNNNNNNNNGSDPRTTTLEDNTEFIPFQSSNNISHPGHPKSPGRVSPYSGSRYQSHSSRRLSLVSANSGIRNDGIGGGSICNDESDSELSLLPEARDHTESSIMEQLKHLESTNHIVVDDDEDNGNTIVDSHSQDDCYADEEYDDDNASAMYSAFSNQPLSPNVNVPMNMSFDSTSMNRPNYTSDNNDEEVSEEFECGFDANLDIDNSNNDFDEQYAENAMVGDDDEMMVIEEEEDIEEETKDVLYEEEEEEDDLPVVRRFTLHSYFKDIDMSHLRKKRKKFHWMCALQKRVWVDGMTTAWKEVGRTELLHSSTITDRCISFATQFTLSLLATAKTELQVVLFQLPKAKNIDTKLDDPNFPEKVLSSTFEANRILNECNPEIVPSLVLSLPLEPPEQLLLIGTRDDGPKGDSGTLVLSVCEADPNLPLSSDLLTVSDFCVFDGSRRVAYHIKETLMESQFTLTVGRELMRLYVERDEQHIASIQASLDQIRNRREESPVPSRSVVDDDDDKHKSIQAKKSFSADNVQKGDGPRDTVLSKRSISMGIEESMSLSDLLKLHDESGDKTSLGEKQLEDSIIKSKKQLGLLKQVVEALLESNKALFSSTASVISNFRSSVEKKERDVQIIPVNCHVHSIETCVLPWSDQLKNALISYSPNSQDNAFDESKCDPNFFDYGDYHVTSMGAFTSHAQGFKKKGGLLRQRDNFKKSVEKFVASKAFDKLNAQKPIVAATSKMLERRDQVMCQAVATLVTMFIQNATKRCDETDEIWWNQLADLGFLTYFESLLSTRGHEEGMIEDFVVAVSTLAFVGFEIVTSRPQNWPIGSTINLTSQNVRPAGREKMRDGFVEELASVALDEDWLGAGKRLIVQVWLGDEFPTEILPRTLVNGSIIWTKPVFFTQGINEQQTLANTRLQDRVNKHNLSLLEHYVEEFNPAYLIRGSSKDLADSMKAAKKLFLCPIHTKNVEFLWAVEKLAVILNMARFTSCKSAKDRTSMGVTLEMVHFLRNFHSFPDSQTSSLLQAMRIRGVRRSNVRKNVGKARYAFNSIQIKSLPLNYRPPEGTTGSTES